MNERIIQQQVYSLFQNYDYKLFNTFMFAWESDFFAISKSGYSVEVEVKISRSDFKADEKKIAKHHLLNNYNKPVIITNKIPFEPWYHPWYLPGYKYNPDTHEYRNGDSSYVSFCCPANHIPNKFYYAVPLDLIKVHEVPVWAGLIYIKTHVSPNANDANGIPLTSYTYEVIKQAPFLHKNIRDFKSDLLSKYYYRHFDIKDHVNRFIRSVEHTLTDYQKDAAKILRSKFY